MAEDHIFYKRYNFLSVPMEEYEVRDVAHRYESPDLHLSLHVIDPQPIELIVEEGHQHPFARVSIIANLSNNSSAPAMYLVIRLYIDAGLQILDSGGLSNDGQKIIEVNNGKTLANVLSLNWGTPGKMPVWESIAFRVTEIRLAISVDERPYALLWEVHSPLMLPRKGTYMLSASGIGSASALVSITDV